MTGSLASNEYMVIGLYNPPNGDIRRLLTAVQELIQQHRTRPTIVLGDFNVEASFPSAYRTACLLKGMAGFGLRMVPSAPTRIVGEVSSTIDLLWVNSLCKATVEVGFTYLSDHMPMGIYVNFSQARKSPFPPLCCSASSIICHLFRYNAGPALQC